MITPTVLYAFTGGHCEVCTEAMPDFRTWAAARVDKCPLVEINTELSERRPGGVKVKVTPTYALVRGEDVLASHEGTFGSEREFEKWLERAL